MQSWFALADHRFGAFLDSMQLVLPVTFEGPGPLVKRPYRFGVGPVHLLPALAAHPNQPHVAQHPQVLRDGRLLQAERCHNLSDRPLCPSEIAQDLSSAGFSDRVECVRCGARSCHDPTLHTHMGICQEPYYLTVGVAQLLLSRSIPDRWGSLRTLQEPALTKSKDGMRCC